MTEMAVEAMQLVRRGFHSVVFQPICRLADSHVIGYEALMRGPEGTALANPSLLFRGVAEEPNVLHELDAACLVSAVRLGRLFTNDTVLFVNMHGETLLRRPRTADEIVDVIRTLSIPFGSLIIEISETTGAEHVRAVARSLAELRAAGVRIALDDVTSEFAYHLLPLDPDFLKIDRTFTRELAVAKQEREQVETIVRYASTIGAEVIIEGIETDAERIAAVDAGVKLGQGYLLGRPLPAQSWLPPEEASFERTHVPGLLERLS